MYHLDSIKRQKYLCRKCGENHYYDSGIGKKHFRWGKGHSEKWREMEFLDGLKTNYNKLKQEKGYISYGDLKTTMNISEFEKKMMKYENQNKFRVIPKNIGLPIYGDIPKFFASGKRLFELEFHY